MDAPKPVPVFRARIDDLGHIRPTEVGRFAGYLAKLRGRDVEVIVRPERKHRSLNANRYYWGVVLAAGAEWSGHDAEELHEVFKGRFLPVREIVAPTGEVLTLPSSTADLDTEAFGNYVNAIIRWLAEQGVHVPQASEVA